MLEIISISASIASLMVSCFSLGMSYTTWRYGEKVHQQMLDILESVHNVKDAEDIKIVRHEHYDKYPLTDDPYCSGRSDE